MKKDLSRSERLGAKTLYLALQIIKSEGGSLPSREVVEKVGNVIDLSDWAKGVYEKSGYIRWQAMLHFFSIDAAKAGYIRKQKGIWYLTEEGEQTIDEFSEIDFFRKIRSAYKDWASKNKSIGIKQNNLLSEKLDSEKLDLVTIDQVEQSSKEMFENHIQNKNPYEFQDMVAALLRAMGYFTPFVAPRGKDGGIDIFAYQDPLGTKIPRIKVQVKHRINSNVSVTEIQQLIGTLGSTDVGILVTSGSYTKEAQDSIRTANRHITLIDFDRFIDLWIEFYPKMIDEDKQLMPLRLISFVAPDEE